MRAASRCWVLLCLLTLALAACQPGAQARSTAVFATTQAPPVTAPRVPKDSAAALTSLPAAAEPGATARPTPSGAAQSGTPATGAAFGKPFNLDNWTSGDKLGVGTAYTYDQAAPGRPAPSRVWFGLTGGAITELTYPTVDQANVRELSLLVGGPHGVQREIDPAAWITPTVEYLDPHALAYRLTTRDPGGKWQAQKEILTDPAGDALVTRWLFMPQDPAYTGYAYLVPHLAGSGRRDNLAVRDAALVAWDEAAKVYAVLLADPPPGRESVGYLRQSDGLTDLAADGRLDWTFAKLPGPNYGAGVLALPANTPVTLALGFGATEQAARQAAQASLNRGFDVVAQDYIAGWQRYLGKLNATVGDDPLYWVSAMLLKAHADKTHLGAAVASLSTPWGQCLADDKPGEAGYRYVWPRDLYHVAMAQLALGDKDGARRILDYMAAVLQKPDGSFPQNVYVDGRPRWNAVQMDETADPILLAAALDAQDLYGKLVKPAADFIAAKGPTTQQERWEENGGYAPHSIASQVAALAAAADAADRAQDAASAAAWRARADAWAGQLDAWTFTTNGPIGNGRYYLRVTEDGQPNNAAAQINIGNGGGRHTAQEFVDVSALELVRLGLRWPDAPAILSTIAALDALISEQTPAGPAWHRYTYDAYGEARPDQCGLGQGRLWPLFTGERGLYDVAAGNLDRARARLAELQHLANPGLLLSEQVYASGAGSGSATPLVWAHAEYIMLARAIAEGRVLDLPSAAASRYLK